jgi:ATP-dependent DNA ligase
VSLQGWNMSHAFPELVGELDRLPSGTAIDGELLMADEDGCPQFDRLLGLPAVSRPGSVARASRRQPPTIACWDILMLAGRDLRKMPLIERKAVLSEVLRGRKRIRYAEHVVESGERMFAEAEFLALEGIVAKRMASSYVAGVTPDWLKIRTSMGKAMELRRAAKPDR